MATGKQLSELSSRLMDGKGSWSLWGTVGRHAYSSSFRKGTSVQTGENKEFLKLLLFNPQNVRILGKIEFVFIIPGHA